MADKKFIEIKVGTGNSKAEVDKLDKSMVNLGKDTDKTSDSLGHLSKVAAAVASAISVKQIIDYADAWTTVNNKLANSIRANEKLADVTQRVFDISQDTRSSLDATANLYQKLERSTRNYNVTAEQLAKLTTTINQGFIVSGATVQEAETAITQLGQGLAAGALRGDEFNTVNENGNRLIIALADSMGRTTGEMRKLAEQGKLTTDVIVNGLLKQSDVIEKEYTKTVATFAQRTQEATQNLTKFVGESVLVQSSVAAFGDVMVLASTNIQTMIDLATALTVVYLSRLTPALVANVASIYAMVTAQLRATVTTNAFGQVIGRTTVAANASTIAIRGMSGALALIGGPVGAAFIAAAAIVYFYESAETAKETADRLSKEVDTLSASFTGLNDAQRAVQISKINTEMGELRDKLIKANTALNNWTETAKSDPFAYQKVKQYKNEVEDLNKSLNDLSVKQQAVFASGLPSISNTTSTGTKKPTATETGKKPKLDLADLPDAEYSARYVANEVASTQAYATELENRKELFNQFTLAINAAQEGSFEQQRLMMQAAEFEQITSSQASLQSTLDKINEERQLLIDNDRITAEARAEIRLQLDEQEITAKADFEQSLTEISAEGIAARQRLADAERAYNLSVASGAFSDLLGLAAGHSRKAFELAKVGAIATAVITGYDAAVKAWDAGMSTGGPWAPAVAAGYTAASLLKTGSLIAGIKRQSYSGGGSQTAGGGGGGVSVSTGAGNGASVAPAQQPTTTQIIDLRGITADTILTGQSLIDILAGTEGVAVALDGVMQEGRRLGQIQ